MENNKLYPSILSKLRYNIDHQNPLKPNPQNISKNQTLQKSQQEVHENHLHRRTKYP